MWETVARAEELALVIESLTHAENYLKQKRDFVMYVSLDPMRGFDKGCKATLAQPGKVIGNSAIGSR